MPEQGHWEPCSDVEALAALNEYGGRAQAECAGGWEAIHWDTCADCLYRTAVNIALTARPGRKFQRWVPTPFGVGDYVRRADGSSIYPRKIARIEHSDGHWRIAFTKDAYPTLLASDHAKCDPTYPFGVGHYVLRATPARQGG